MEKFDAELQDRLVRYTSIDSQSKETSCSIPGTAIQYDLLNLLKQELKEIGASEVQLTNYGTVLATIPGNIDAPTIGFLAHVDTAPRFNATDVKPRVIKSYNGGDITFLDYLYLAIKQDHNIIIALGDTLLRAEKSVRCHDHGSGERTYLQGRSTPESDTHRLDPG